MQCAICQEWVNPASAYWVTIEDARFHDDGYPRVHELEPYCEECTLRVMLDKDVPRHTARRPRPPDSK